MADLVASAPAAVLHRAQLCQASLGEILHVVLPPLHPVDRHLLLLHGLDGEWSRCVESRNSISGFLSGLSGCSGINWRFKIQGSSDRNLHYDAFSLECVFRDQLTVLWLKDKGHGLCNLKNFKNG